MFFAMICRMGTHPSGTSTIAEGAFAGQSLLEFIKDNPEVLGKSLGAFGRDIPYLLKVLSVRTALSIQSHPDKALAERLHMQRPDIYKDANHKPEMAVALSKFEAMCGFCAHEELCEYLRSVPELVDVIGAEKTNAYISSQLEDRRNHLKNIFTALMTADALNVKEAVKEMINRLEMKHQRNHGQLSKKENLVLRLNSQYPNDVGVLAAWFLNFVELEPGEAIALSANEPHAYVSGDIVECMATSDNVVRAGLTPKFRDTDVLCASLTYMQGSTDIMQGQRLHTKETGDQTSQTWDTVVFRPHFKEFEVWHTLCKVGASFDLPGASGPMILLVHHGTGQFAWGSNDKQRNVARGQVFFIPAGLKLKYVAEDDTNLWIAAPNGMGL